MNKINIIIITLILISLNVFSQNFQDDVLAFEKSYTLEYEGNYSQAISALKQTYTADSYEYNVRLGWLDYLAGQYTESVSFYNKAIDLKPMSIEAKFGLIYPLLALGKIDQTIEIYHHILKISPMDSKANYRLGLLLYQHKRYKEADAYLKNIINIYPFDYDTIILMAWNSYQMGKSTEARLLFQKALLNQPSDESAKEGLRLVN